MYHPHDRVQIDFEDAPMMTKQSFQKECNINEIMSKFDKTGLLEHLNNHQGDYGNFLGFEDYHTSVNRVIEANEAFMTIPAAVRAKFQNDPAKFMEFAQNEENTDELIEMGLANPRPPDPLKERVKAHKVKDGSNLMFDTEDPPTPHKKSKETPPE